MRISVVRLYDPVMWEYSRVYRWLLVLGRSVELGLTVLRFLTVSLPLRLIRGEKEADLAPPGDTLMTGTRVDVRDDFGKVSYERKYWEDERLEVREKSRYAPTSKWGWGPLVRVLLEELGPTFIKLGQFLSVRPEMPVPIQKELQRLQERVPTFGFKEVRKTLQKEFGVPIEEVYSYFEEKPFAAASLAQVHRAKLRREGVEVAVKVRRPYIDGTVMIDLIIIELLLNTVKRLIPEVGKKTDVRIVMTGFGGMLKKEIDFRREAAAQERTRGWFYNNPYFKDHVKIAELYGDYVTGKVLTMELLHGFYRCDTEESLKVCRDTTHIGIPKWDCNQWPLVNVGGAILMDTMYESRFAYMDSHFGNIYFIPEEKKYVIVDFGMCEELTEREVDLFVDIIASLCIFADPHKMVEAILDMHEYGGGKRKTVDVNKLFQGCSGWIERHTTSGEGDVQGKGSSDWTADLFSILGAVGLSLPTFLWYFLKSASGLVRLGVLIDPRYDTIPFQSGYIGDNLKKRILARLQTSDIVNVGEDMKAVSRVLTSIPQPETRMWALAKMKAEQDEDSMAAKIRSKGSFDGRKLRVDSQLETNQTQAL